MTVVQEIKQRHNMDALLDAIRPRMEENVKRRRKEELDKAKNAHHQKTVMERKARVNAALHNAGIPLQIL